MIICYIDGACEPNPGQMGVGVLAYDSNHWRVEISEAYGLGTSNQAEYFALNECLDLLLSHHKEKEDIILYTDSRLMERQVNGHWKVNDSELKRLHKVVTNKINKFLRIRLEHVPREKNEQADYLSTLCITC